MSNPSYTPIPSGFNYHDFGSCTGYRGFSVDYVTMNYNQTTCVLNSTRNFDAIEKCCSNALNGTLQSVGGSSLTFCTTDGDTLGRHEDYYNCFKNIPLPTLPAGSNYTNLTAYVNSEIGGCGTCGPKESNANHVIPKAGIAVVAIVLGMMFTSL